MRHLSRPPSYLAVAFLFVAAEFQHISQNGDTAAIHLLQEVQRCDGRSRARVVAVVYDGASVNAGNDLHSEPTSHDLKGLLDFLQRKAAGEAHGGGGQGRVDAVPSLKARSHRPRGPLPVKGEPETLEAATVRVFCPHIVLWAEAVVHHLSFGPACQGV